MLAKCNQKLIDGMNLGQQLAILEEFIRQLDSSYIVMQLYMIQSFTSIFFNSVLADTWPVVGSQLDVQHSLHHTQHRATNVNIGSLINKYNQSYITVTIYRGITIIYVAIYMHTKTGHCMLQQLNIQIRGSQLVTLANQLVRYSLVTTFKMCSSIGNNFFYLLELD